MSAAHCEHGRYRGQGCSACNPPNDYMVKCARCGKEGRASTFEMEEGDEWECGPCWNRQQIHGSDSDIDSTCESLRHQILFRLHSDPHRHLYARGLRAILELRGRCTEAERILKLIAGGSYSAVEAAGLAYSVIRDDSTSMEDVK
jgi:hypothetical protein